MYKVKIFSESRPSLLQEQVNTWLHDNKDLLIHTSNFSAGLIAPDGNIEFHVYMLYSQTSAQQEELKELAATAKPELSIEVKEINPEILQPSS